MRDAPGSLPVRADEDTAESRVPPGTGSWYDLARHALPLWTLAADLEASITQRLEDEGEAVVDLGSNPDTRELWLDLLHSRVFTGADFDASRARFFARFKGLKRARLKVEWVEEPWFDEQREADEDGWFRLDIYAGRSRFASRRLRGLFVTWQVDALCWLFHRAGVDPAQIDPTMEGVVPGYCLFVEDDD